MWMCRCVDVCCVCLEEEISEMAKALEKYGIQMPSFGKIGGILASEIQYDEAASECSTYVRTYVHYSLYTTPHTVCLVLYSSHQSLQTSCHGDMG